MLLGSKRRISEKNDMYDRFGRRTHLLPDFRSMTNPSMQVSYSISTRNVRVLFDADAARQRTLFLCSKTPFVRGFATSPILPFLPGQPLPDV